ncbi:hypothetical protein L1987_00074 [Smallanthus sonchifolius]|uniref:Uncharacterized protein n=1 Tax=Smallanthus sonchifolius TaxID=185202 RepID=A0ACB9K1A9_9ASTR|nr:hypothetical protein L1987_00074 [Smallanthus sonchifolius]
MLWGRLTDPTHRARHRVVHNGQEILYYLVFEGIKDQIDPESKDTFVDIAGLCLAHKKYRPRATEVVTKLDKALKIQISNTPEIYDSMDAEIKNNLHDMFSKGTLLKDDKVWLSLGSNGERNEMISAKMFSYKNRKSLKWRSVRGSRFPKAAEISIYIEGIQFQAIENVNREELKEVQNVLKENSNTDKVKEDHEQEEKQEMTLSAKKVVLTPSEMMIPLIRLDLGLME